MVLIFHLGLTLKGHRVTTYGQIHKLCGPHQVHRWLFPLMRVPQTPYNYINWQYWASQVLAFKGPDKDPRAVSGEILDKSNWDASVSKLVSREIFNAWSVKILVFPSSTGYMLYSFGFSLSIWGKFYRFMFIVPSRSTYMLISFGFLYQLLSIQI